MPISYMELLKLRFEHISSSEAAAVLGITQSAVSRLAREGKVSGVKIGGVYMITRLSIQEYAKHHEPRRGRPRQKRRYTRRSKPPTGQTENNGTAEQLQFPSFSLPD